MQVVASLLKAKPLADGRMSPIKTSSPVEPNASVPLMVSLQIRYSFVMAFVEQGNPDDVCIASLVFSSYLKCLLDTSNAVEDN